MATILKLDVKADASILLASTSCLELSKTEHEKADKVKYSNTNNNEKTAPVSLVEKTGVNVKEEDTFALIFGEELTKYGFVLKTTNSEEIQEYKDNVTNLSDIKLDELEVIDVSDTRTQQKETKENVNKKGILTVRKSNVPNVLMVGEHVDENYTGKIVELSSEDRDLLERLVQGEAGGEGYEGAALVAQAIRDTLIDRGFNSVAEVRQALSYTGSIEKEPNEHVKKAVSFIFDNGGSAVQHSLYYFYAPGTVKSAFHESQKFIIELGGHRFFSAN